MKSDFEDTQQRFFQTWLWLTIYFHFKKIGNNLFQNLQFSLIYYPVLIIVALWGKFLLWFALKIFNKKKYTKIFRLDEEALKRRKKSEPSAVEQMESVNFKNYSFLLFWNFSKF